jgi:hypothetical protein
VLWVDESVVRIIAASGVLLSYSSRSRCFCQIIIKKECVARLTDLGMAAVASGLCNALAGRALKNPLLVVRSVLQAASG